MSTYKHFQHFRQRYELGLLFFLGVGGAVLFSATHIHIPFVEHLFMAVAVSTFIAFFVEVALHQQFARNVFEASIGYLLPEPLRDALRWIYDQPFLCEKHIQTTTVKRIAERPGLVIATTEATRIFRNITSSKKKFTPSISVNEWFRDESYRSRILRYTCCRDDEPAVENLAAHDVPSDGAHVSLPQPVAAIEVAPRERIRASFLIEEVLNESDSAYLHFGAPTGDVSVTVQVPQGIVADVRFSHRDGDPKLTKVGANSWYLRGLLLPLQGIRIHWYPEDKYEAWKASFSA